MHVCFAYVDKVKGQGAMRVFPGVAVHNGKPFYTAGPWFTGLLDAESITGRVEWRR